MATYDVALQPDHLERFTRTTSPAKALAELVWNACDADATLVEIVFMRNTLGGVEAVKVVDNGTGLDSTLTVNAFRNFGTSWKSVSMFTRHNKRAIHGRNGEGRFFAFTLGSKVSWESVTKSGNKFLECQVDGLATQISQIKVDPFIDSVATQSGTVVSISNLYEKGQRAASDQVRMSLTKDFAPYLLNYPDVKIIFDGFHLNVDEWIKQKKDFILDDISLSDRIIENPKLSIIEWDFDADRNVIFCDASGFALHEAELRIQARGFNFSTYLSSNEFRSMNDKGTLTLGDMSADFTKIMDVVKIKTKDYFRARKAEEARNIVDRWKEEGVYPYKEEPVTNVEVLERQVFDIVSSQISEYMPSFDKNTEETKKFQLALIKRGLEDSPEHLIKIIQEVLNLPGEKVSELHDLLRYTSLSNIINSAKLVADRLKFLQGMKDIIYDHTSKKLMKERTQLHRITADNTWMFGEQFNLTVDDQSLNQVLKAHLSRLKEGRHDLEGLVADEVDDSPVLRSDGRKGIVDIMLSKSQRTLDGRLEHLILELKRPSVKIDLEVLGQAFSYAVAIAKDSRFEHTNTNWVFWAVSNEMTEDGKEAVSEPGRPFGLYKKGENYEVWAMTWAQIIEACLNRMIFFKQQLDFTPNSDESIKFLREKYAKYLEGVQHSSDAIDNSLSALEDSAVVLP